MLNDVIITQPFSLVTNQMLEITLNNYILDTHPKILFKFYYTIDTIHHCFSMEVSPMKPYIQLVIKKQWLQYVFLISTILIALGTLWLGQKLAQQNFKNTYRHSRYGP